MAAIFPQNSWQGRRFHDPWMKADQWRYEHPLVATKYTKWRAVPGFGWATAAFAAYCAVDYFLFADHGHAHQHKKHGEDVAHNTTHTSTNKGH